MEIKISKNEKNLKRLKRNQVFVKMKSVLNDISNLLYPDKNSIKKGILLG